MAPAQRWIKLHGILLLAVLLLITGSTDAGQQGVTADAIVVGQSNAFSGMLGELGTEYRKGAELYLNAINASGGIHGRKIVLVSLDDGYDPQRTVENTRKLVAEHQVFALAFYIGTANTEAVLPILEASRIPLVGTLSGADSLRAPAYFSKYLFHTKAGYSDEIRKIFRQLTTTGFNDIAVVYQNNSFGKKTFATAEALMKEYKLSAVASVAVDTDGGNIPEAVKTLSAAAPRAVILLTAGSVSQNLVRAYSKTSIRPQLFSLSFGGTTSFIKDLGTLSRGTIVTQTVPYPWSATNALVREYQENAKKGGVAISMVSMEGYIAAKVLVEGLRRAGKDPTREKMTAALNNFGAFDLGGFWVHYGSGNHNGATAVEVTIIDSYGRFIR
ncbi:MAG: extracellular ligand binding protein [Noviherbaspirillum sp.]|nr:extracellular ligand binding protein [Noviherbaspirillum sp.]